MLNILFFLISEESSQVFKHSQNMIMKSSKYETFSEGRKGNVKRHIDSVHNKLKPHKCLMCNYTSSQKGTLKRHIDSIHNQLKAHKCTMCDYTT